MILCWQGIIPLWLLHHLRLQRWLLPLLLRLRINILWLMGFRWRVGMRGLKNRVVPAYTKRLSIGLVRSIQRRYPAPELSGICIGRGLRRRRRVRRGVHDHLSSFVYLLARKGWPGHVVVWNPKSDFFPIWCDLLPLLEQSRHKIFRSN